MSPIPFKTARRGESGFALVLGGGGARGLAHIGVLKALERKGYFPNLIVGTSMGAIVGGMYAQLPSASQVERRMRELLLSAEFRDVGLTALSTGGKNDGSTTVALLYRRMRRGYVLLKSGWSTGLVEDSILLKSLCRLLDDRRIQDCVIPFAAVSCDLMSGREIVLRTGSILRAVAASSAIPGVVTPVSIKRRLLVDGAPTSMVPVQACRSLTALPVIAVTVNRDLHNTSRLQNAIDVVLRSKMISELTLAECSLEDADVVIRPSVGSYGWADFTPFDALVAKGVRAATRALSEIARLTNRAGMRRDHPRRRK
jgi:NTE family protein